MKKRILVVLSVMVVFGLFVSAFALSRTTVANEKTAVSCCPMHKQTAKTASGENQKDSCCGMDDCCKDDKCSTGGDCCKDKDSCPIKKNTDTSSAQSMDISKVVVSTSGDDCCQRAGADCCKGGACCHKKS